MVNKKMYNNTEMASYILASTYRKKTLEYLNKHMGTPSLISDNTSIRRQHISNVLSDLKEKGLVECLNEEVRKGRLYKITNKGKESLEIAQEVLQWTQ